MTTATAAHETVAEWPHYDVKSLQSALYRYCLTLTKSRQDAEDLAQDAWGKALPTLQGSGHRNAEAFMLRIAKNAWIDRLRRRTFEARLLLLDRPNGASTEEDIFEIERMMGTLVMIMSPLQRTVFLLRDAYGFTAAEAAERLQTTEGAVKAALHRARAALASVREQLVRESSPDSEDRGLHIYLRALAAAYRNDDLASVVALAQQDVLPPVTAISLARRIGNRKTGESILKAGIENNYQTAWLAA